MKANRINIPGIEAALPLAARILIFTLLLSVPGLSHAPLLRAQPSPGEPSEAAVKFTELCAQGTVDEVAAAIASGADVNAPGLHYMPPLSAVALFDETDSAAEKLELLLAAGADPNQKEAEAKNTPLHYAADRAYTELMKNTAVRLRNEV